MSWCHCWLCPLSNTGPRAGFSLLSSRPILFTSPGKPVPGLTSLETGVMCADEEGNTGVGGEAVPTPRPLRKLAEVCWGPCSWGDRGHGGAAKGSWGKILPKGARRCHFKPRFSHERSYVTSSVWAAVPFGRKGCFSSAGHDGGSRCRGQGVEVVVHGPSPCSF